MPMRRQLRCLILELLMLGTMEMLDSATKWMPDQVPILQLATILTLETTTGMMNSVILAMTWISEDLPLPKTMALICWETILDSRCLHQDDPQLVAGLPTVHMHPTTLRPVVCLLQCNS
mmetsp:Transcript_61091/g.171171  ORF Transcript_61091/g.171171 Transcript_61091/m.171171 type:complete len:119 (+) Transcript_61091:119-475(+)